jgi:hypothetical protein
MPVETDFYESLDYHSLYNQEKHVVDDTKMTSIDKNTLIINLSIMLLCISIFYWHALILETSRTICTQILGLFGSSVSKSSDRSSHSSSNSLELDSGRNGESYDSSKNFGAKKSIGGEDDLIGHDPKLKSTRKDDISNLGGSESNSDSVREIHSHGYLLRSRRK